MSFGFDPVEQVRLYRALLDAPCVGVAEIPWLTRVAWKRDGGVYIARTADGLIKIGYGYCAPGRVYDQRLEALAFILPAGCRHERRLHSEFSRERVTGEYFRGDRLEDFVQVVRRRVAPRLRDIRGASRNYVDKERFALRRLARAERAA